MRQAGVIAAAVLYALDHNVERLADDHRRARRLAEGIGLDPDSAETNFVAIDVPAATSYFKNQGPADFKAKGLDMELIPIAAGTADMTAQMQRLVSGNPDGVAFVIGNDAFCIAAFNGMRTAQFKGHVTSIQQCLSDATRTAVPGDFLKGMQIAATSPLDDPKDPSIAAGLSWMLAQGLPSRTYEQALCLMALDRAFTPMSEDDLIRAGRLKTRTFPDGRTSRPRRSRARQRSIRRKLRSGGPFQRSDSGAASRDPTSSSASRRKRPISTSSHENRELLVGLWARSASSQRRAPS